jgi:hypothetical protein
MTFPVNVESLRKSFTTFLRDSSLEHEAKSYYESNEKFEVEGTLKWDEQKHIKHSHEGIKRRMDLGNSYSLFMYKKT